MDATPRSKPGRCSAPRLVPRPSRRGRGSRPRRGSLPRARILALCLGLSAGAWEGEGEGGEEGGEGRPGAPATRQADPLAVTIDDIPWVGATHPGETQLDATRRLLAALAAHGVTAVGFVNCDRVTKDSPVLRAWLDAGQRVGNHTAAHLDLNRAEPGRWLRDARRCHAFVEDLDDGIVWFRYPYLHQGQTAARRRAAAELLAELGSRNAHVSIDTSDWILAAAYGDALRRGDAALQREIGAAFIDHVLAAAAHYRAVARERAQRDIAHVLLLHANALVADHLDDLLGSLRAEGFRFVPLEDALADPVYDRPDDYTGPDGLSWLYRFEPAAPELKAWDDAEAAALRERFGR
jgi:peptidoglycan-N-acetylglucosamine deacetylase